jgi:hypothetical protein
MSSPAKDTGDDVSDILFRCSEVYRTARMTTWKAFETVVENVAVRLVTYCHSLKDQR